MNYHPKSDEEQVPEGAAHRTPWYHQMHRTGKQTIYWPRINSDIEQFMATCQPCLKYAASNKKFPEKKNQLGQEIPVTPWTKLGTDIFTLDGTNHLLLVNYTSKFPVM